MFDVPVVRYRFDLVAESELHFPKYAGSMWRGAFGQALKQTVCVTRQPECHDCLLQRSCVYSQVFATPAGLAPLLEKGDAAPHPYIWHPHATSGAHYQTGDTFSVQLTLLGAAIAALPYMIHSVQVMGQRGLGKTEGRYALQCVWQEQTLGLGDEQVIYAPTTQPLQPLAMNPVQIPVAPQAIRIEFHTPFRAKREGRLMRGNEFAFRPFFMHLVRRCSLLQVQYVAEYTNPDDAFYRTLRMEADAVSVEKQAWRWFEWSRYSNRQQRRVDMDGLLGSFELHGETWQRFWPWLWWGQWLLVGKGAVMGLGQYTVTVLEGG